MAYLANNNKPMQIIQTLPRPPIAAHPRIRTSLLHFATIQQNYPDECKYIASKLMPPASIGPMAVEHFSRNREEWSAAGCPTPVVGG